MPCPERGNFRHHPAPDTACRVPTGARSDRCDSGTRSVPRCSDARGRPGRRRAPRARGGQVSPSPTCSGPRSRSTAAARSKQRNAGMRAVRAWARRIGRWPGRPVGVDHHRGAQRDPRAVHRMHVEEAARQVSEARHVTEPLHRHAPRRQRRAPSAPPSAAAAVGAPRARARRCSGRAGRGRRATTDRLARRRANGRPRAPACCRSRMPSAPGRSKSGSR